MGRWALQIYSIKKLWVIMRQWCLSLFRIVSQWKDDEAQTVVTVQDPFV